MNEPGCRELCSLRNEPLVGSAGKAPFWVGISWPKPLWHPDRVAQSGGLPPEIGGLEAEAAARGAKLALRLFQRTTAPPRDRVELLLFARGARALSLDSVPIDAVASIVSAFLAGDPIEARATPMSPQLLVCTDGKHDACCARYGRALHRALASEVERTGANVALAESSHLGGHRFAACCLALPGGHLYGRVEETDASQLVRAATTGDILLERLRGELGHTEVCQVARAAARRAGYAPDGDEEAHVVGDRATVRLPVRHRDGASHVVVQCEREPFAGVNSCGHDAPVEPNARWVDRTVTAV